MNQDEYLQNKYSLRVNAARKVKNESDNKSKVIWTVIKAETN